MEDRKKFEGWKQIAAHLGKSIKTAQRWKDERGLPVQQDRVSGRVFAYEDDLDRWSASQVGLKEDPVEPVAEAAAEAAVVPEVVQAPVVAVPALSPVRAGRQEYGPVLLILGLVVLGSMATLAIFAGRITTETGRAGSPRVTAGRLLWRATAEGKGFERIPIPDPAKHLAVTPDGRMLLGFSSNSNRLWVVDTRTGQTRWAELGTVAMTMAVAPNGRRVYVGSGQDGLVEVALPGLRVKPSVPTGGAVNDIAITPDSGQLFLAMMHRGVKRFDVSAGTVTEFVKQPCPFYVDVSPDGKQLAVSYQCGGVVGKDGHDTVEVLDIETRKPLKVLAGPPMVAGGLRFSPDGEFVWVDGWDACRTPKYDHVGCPAVPAWMWQVFRLADERFYRTVVLPADSQRRPEFVGGSAVMTGGGSIAVLDPVRFTTRESLEDAWVGDMIPAGEAVFTAGGSPENSRFVMKMEREPAECALPESALVHFLPFDGAGDDWVENARVQGAGKLQYGGGLVGRALRLNEDTRALLHSTAETRFGGIASTLTMYVKPARSGAMQVLEIPVVDHRQGWSLKLDAEMKPVLDLHLAGGGKASLQGTVAVEPDRWTHLALVREGDTFRCYVDGKAAGWVFAPGLTMINPTDAYRLGNGSGAGPFVGMVDEMALWARAFSEREIRAEVEKRAQGRCRP